MAGIIARGIASGIGLAREAAASKKESKEDQPKIQDAQPEAADTSSQTLLQPRSRSPQPRAPSPGTQSNDEGYDEEDEYLWNLDDVQQTETGMAQPFANARNEEQLVKEFQRRHPPPAYTEQEGQLPCPVCIPQRRPRHRTRGFIRAYAPILQEVGIDQAMFLDFIAGFEQAIKLHQVFNAVQVVVKGTDLAIQITTGPNVAAHAASWIVHAGVEASRRAYVQYKTNQYLDEMNTTFFSKHGVYALIMCYKPSADNLQPSDSIAKAVSNRSDGHGSKMERASGYTRSELELPESAPLIFPALDASDDKTKESSRKRAGNFLGDYYDRRAQARFEYQNPNSKLSVAPREEFHSRYADPNSAAASGGLIGLVSGGKIKGPRYRIREHRREKKIAQGLPAGGRSSFLAEDVFYLLIVNVPTEEEIKEAKRILWQDQAW